MLWEGWHAWLRVVCVSQTTHGLFHNSAGHGTRPPLPESKLSDAVSLSFVPWCHSNSFILCTDICFYFTSNHFTSYSQMSAFNYEYISRLQRRIFKSLKVCLPWMVQRLRKPVIRLVKNIPENPSNMINKPFSEERSWRSLRKYDP